MGLLRVCSTTKTLGGNAVLALVLLLSLRKSIESAWFGIHTG